MGRILEGFVETIWANSPRDAADIQEPSQARQDEGYDRDYFQPGGDLPEGEIIQLGSSARDRFRAWTCSSTASWSGTRISHTSTRRRRSPAIMPT